MNGILLTSLRDTYKIKDFELFFKEVGLNAKKEEITFEEALGDLYIIHKTNHLTANLMHKMRAVGTEMPHDVEVFLNMSKHTLNVLIEKLEGKTEELDKIVNSTFSKRVSDMVKQSQSQNQKISNEEE